MRHVYGWIFIVIISMDKCCFIFYEPFAACFLIFPPCLTAWKSAEKSLYGKNHNSYYFKVPAPSSPNCFLCGRKYQHFQKQNNCYDPCPICVIYVSFMSMTACAVVEGWQGRVCTAFSCTKLAKLLDMHSKVKKTLNNMCEKNLKCIF